MFESLLSSRTFSCILKVFVCASCTDIYWLSGYLLLEEVAPCSCGIHIGLGIRFEVCAWVWRLHPRLQGELHRLVIQKLLSLKIETDVFFDGLNCCEFCLDFPFLGACWLLNRFFGDHASKYIAFKLFSCPSVLSLAGFKSSESRSKDTFWLLNLFEHTVDRLFLLSSLLDYSLSGYINLANIHINRVLASTSLRAVSLVLWVVSEGCFNRRHCLVHHLFFLCLFVNVHDIVHFLEDCLCNLLRHAAEVTSGTILWASWSITLLLGVHIALFWVIVLKLKRLSALWAFTGARPAAHCIIYIFERAFFGYEVFLGPVSRQFARIKSAFSLGLPTITVLHLYAWMLARGK